VSTFAVIREAGPAWATGGIYDQPAVDEHAAFMNALADRAFLLFAGPLAGSEHGTGGKRSTARGGASRRLVVSAPAVAENDNTPRTQTDTSETTRATSRDACPSHEKA
jgi:hypothetical protein